MRENATIAIIAPGQPEDFFDLLWQGVWEATFDLASFGVQVEDLTTPGDDVGEQRKILEGLLEVRPDAIGLLALNASELDDLIDEHVDRGTAVITFLGDAPGSRRAAFVGPNPYSAGNLAGELLVKLIGGRGRVVSFPGSRGEFHSEKRYEGFRDAMQRVRGQVQEDCCCGKEYVHARFTPELLQWLGTAAGYYVGNQDLAAIAEVLESLDAQCAVRPALVGFSNTESIRGFLERGVVSAVIDENRYQVGYFAVQKAFEAVLKREQKAPVASVQIPSTVVFAANAAGAGDSLNSAFELLVRQRTEVLVSYKRRLEDANARLLDLAVTDPLTGLFNRRKFEETLQQEVSRALRYGPLSLLMIDLDRFKEINDRHGHQAGDEALKAVARVLQSSCRGTDTCARLGGDEFAVILAHSDAGAGTVLWDRIQAQMERTAVHT